MGLLSTELVAAFLIMLSIATTFIGPLIIRAASDSLKADTRVAVS